MRSLTVYAILMVHSVYVMFVVSMYRLSRISTYKLWEMIEHSLHSKKKTKNYPLNLFIKSKIKGVSFRYLHQPLFAQNVTVSGEVIEVSTPHIDTVLNKAYIVLECFSNFVWCHRPNYWFLPEFFITVLYFT